MTQRERLATVFHGGLADRVPWAPIITPETLATYPPDVRERGPVAFTREAGGDVLLRGRVLRLIRDGVEVVETKRNGERRLEYRTSCGSLWEVLRAAYPMERKIKSVSDHDAFEALTEASRLPHALSHGRCRL